LFRSDCSRPFSTQLPVTDRISGGLTAATNATQLRRGPCRNASQKT
jgi:hypothetical protein